MRQDFVCPLCKRRISNWQAAARKVVIVEGFPCHNECLQDHALRHGQAWTPSKLERQMENLRDTEGT